MTFEPRDLWVGLYWKRDRNFVGAETLTVYVCLVPMFPIVLYWDWCKN